MRQRSTSLRWSP
ncbi:hypothetical protein LINPERHAP2_LOCUS729 [Linum perenne]